MVEAEKREDGIYCLGSFQREILQDRGFDPTKLADSFSVSMEVTFDRSRAKYLVGDLILSYPEALRRGIASPVGRPDDRTKYDARFIVPLDFHGIAALRRGRNADRDADVLRVAADAAVPDDPFHIDLNRLRKWRSLGPFDVKLTHLL